MNIGENVKKLRELKNISRKQMADKLGMSDSNYSKIERGEVDLTVSRIEQISQILGVSFNEVVNFDASQIFNVSNNQFVHGLGAKEVNVYSKSEDDIKDKYIKKLEEENKTLREDIEKLKSNND